MMTFSDEDVRSLVKAGDLSNPKDQDYLAATLIERRNLIARYWFDRAAALDDFDFKDRTLSFKDLAVEYGFSQKAGTLYHVDVSSRRGKKVASFHSEQPSIALQNWLDPYQDLNLRIRTSRGAGAALSPCVLVQLNSRGISGIAHED